MIIISVSIDGTLINGTPINGTPIDDTPIDGTPTDSTSNLYPFQFMMLNFVGSSDHCLF